MRSFDWPMFGIRLLVIVALATKWLVERIRSHDRTGVVAVVVVGYVIFPVLTYLWMRYLSQPRTDV